MVTAKKRPAKKPVQKTVKKKTQKPKRARVFSFHNVVEAVVEILSECGVLILRGVGAVLREIGDVLR